VITETPHRTANRRLGRELALVTLLAVVLRVPLALVLFPFGDPLFVINFGLAAGGRRFYFVDWIVFGALLVISVVGVVIRRYRTVAMIHLWAAVGFVISLIGWTLYVALGRWPVVIPAGFYIWINVAAASHARSVAREARRA